MPPGPARSVSNVENRRLPPNQRTQRPALAQSVGNVVNRRPALLVHRVSRRNRTVFRGHGHAPFNMEGSMQLRLKDPEEVTGDSLASVVLKSLPREKFCDVELVGTDDVPVGAPSYLLAVHSPVFEEMFYPDSNGDEAKTKPDGRHRVELDFAGMDAIEAAVRFLAARSLPEALEKNPSEYGVRVVCQIYVMGRCFKIRSLIDQASSTARVLVNKFPHLVCAAFDELTTATKIAARKWELRHCQDELKAYALGYMRDSPLKTLLAGGTAFMNAESIEAIMCDQEMDGDEYTMFHVLRSWVMQDEESNHAVGEALVSNINLAYIKKDHLINVVKKCGFVDPSRVDAALLEIEETLANQSKEDKEHVLVEGAGDVEVNGIYVRMEEDIGLGCEEVMFVNECGEDEDYRPDYSLFLFRSKWAIASSFDASNVLYSCEASEVQPPSCRAPSTGWEAVSGANPAPICTWKPCKEGADAGNGRYVAPDLADGGDEERRLTHTSQNDHDEGRNMSLGTMMNLPTDEGHEDDDYHATPQGGRGSAIRFSDLRRRTGLSCPILED